MPEVVSRISGVFYDGKRSRASSRDLQVLADGSACFDMLDASDVTAPPAIYAYPSLRISSRLGNTPRYIHFPDGSKFETKDNTAVDQWQQQFDPTPWRGLLHRLESRRRMVLFSVVAVLLCLWGAVKFGVPAASTLVAERLPYAVSRQLGQGALEMLDDYVFAPSALDASRRQHLQSLFDHYFAGQIASMGLSLHFRASEKIGANAFALPSGAIVFTDAMVALAGDDGELLAVMAHEVGHVAHRHTLRRVIQNSFLLFVLAMVTGDVAGSSSLLVAAPTLLLEMAYSRDFEREADRYALAFLQQHQINPVHFSNLMQRMQWYEAAGRKNDASVEGRSENGWQQTLEEARYYLSSHPDWQQRMETFGAPTLAGESTSN